MDLHGLMWFPAYLRSTHTHIGMDGTVGKKLELLIRTREEDYQELSNKITQVNKQLNVRMDAVVGHASNEGLSWKGLGQDVSHVDTGKQTSRASSPQSGRVSAMLRLVCR